MKVPSGTPVTMATVSPMNIMRDGRGAAVFGCHEIGRDGGADGEEDAMREGREHAAGEQHFIGLG